MLAENAGNTPFQALIREIRDHRGGPRLATTTSSRHGSVGSASKAESARDATLAASLARRSARPRKGRSGAVGSTAAGSAVGPAWDVFFPAAIGSAACARGEIGRASVRERVCSYV